MDSNVDAWGQDSTHLLGGVLAGLGLQHLRVRLDLRPQLVRAQVAKQRLKRGHNESI